MAVYTRYGTALQIQSRISDDGWVWVQREDGAVREYHISDLKADGGIEEIYEAADQFEGEDKPESQPRVPDAHVQQAQATTARDLYRKAYRDARILKYQFPPQYPTSVSAIPLRYKLAARQSIETEDLRTVKGYTWQSATRQHHFELLTSQWLQY